MRTSGSYEGSKGRKGNGRAREWKGKAIVKASEWEGKENGRARERKGKARRERQEWDGRL